MKLIATVIASLFAATAFAAEPAKVTAPAPAAVASAPAAAPAKPAEVKKDAKKATPSKVDATKSAKDQKAEAAKK
jgi:hypothetical protein